LFGSFLEHLSKQGDQDSYHDLNHEILLLSLEMRLNLSYPSQTF